MFTFRKPPPPSDFAIKMSKDIAEMAAEITRRRHDLITAVALGLSSSFCMERGHQIQIVHQRDCDCEGLHVQPFGVAFWTCVDHDPSQGMHTMTVFYGWGSACKHGRPLPLPGPEAHDIVRKGEPLN